MRRTSVYELSVIPRSAVAGTTLDAQLKLLLARMPASAELAGSGTVADAVFVRYRVGGDTAAIRLALHLTKHTRFAARTLSTGQGVNHRTITLEGTTMATKYTLFVDGAQTDVTRAKKSSVIAAGEKLGKGFEVRTETGATVHTHPAPAPAEAHTEKKEPAVATSTAPEVDEDVVGTSPAPKKAPAVKAKPEAPAEPTREVPYASLSKSYLKSAGLHGAEAVGAVYGVTATMSGAVVTLHGADEDTAEVAGQLTALWDSASVAFKEWARTWRNSTKGYDEMPRSEKNEAKFEAGSAYFMAFMDGAADALADKVKRKGGAYKDGVNAVLDPATDDSDVI